MALLLVPMLTIAQWVDNPSVNTVINSTPGAKYVPKVALTPEGNYFFSWYGGTSNLNMNLAYFDHSGVQIWPLGSKTVSSHPQNTWVDDYTLLCDLEGNAIVIFSDIRTGVKNVVVYKVDSLGNQLWGDDGIFFELSTSEDYQPKGVVATDNSVFVFHSTSYANGDPGEIIVHKILPDGTLAWGTLGKKYSGAAGVSWSVPVGTANEDGGFTLGYYKETGNFPATQRNISAIRCNADGNLQWDPEADVSLAGGISPWDDLMMFANGNGGAYFAWHDDRFSDNTYEVYAQHILPDGEGQYTPSGVMVSIETSGHQLYETPAGINNSGEFVVLWNRLNSNQSMGSLVYQRINTSGELLETNAGKTILAMNDRLQNGLGVAQIGDSTFYLYANFLEGQFYYTSYNMVALDAIGNDVWPAHVEMANATLDRTHANMSPFFNYQSVVCWSDNMLGNDRVMGQNIFIDGALGTSPLYVEKIPSTSFEIFTTYDPLTQSLKLENLEPNDMLKVYNLQGQEIISAKAENSIGLNRYMKGMYIAALIRNGKVYEQFKFVM